jgi:NADH dehydrogenase [ubiquinone] 1 alpha subcomplex assembly factor 7
MEQAIILTRNEDLIFSQVPIKKSLAEFLNAEYSDMQIGSIIEMCPHAISLADLMANMMHNHKSAALMIDYGYDYDKSKMEYLSPTLQAIKNHNFHPVLSDIGYADLTAHVDFFSLRQAAILREIQIFGTVTQGEFLNSLGVQMRLQQLLSNASAEQGIELTQGTERLVSNSQMGELFKVMCLTSPGLGDMAGF